MRHRSREFLAVRRVAEALAGFTAEPRRRPETVDLAGALGRVPVAPVRSATDLPGFDRSTVDGFAVRAQDTYGASEGLPAYLTVAGEVAMGRSAGVAVAAGHAVAVPTGGALPAGADAVVMVEHTSRATDTTLEVLRPAAPGDGVITADEDVPAGGDVVPAGRPLRPQDLGLLAAAGITEVTVHARPVVAIVATGDEVVPPHAQALDPGQVRDALSASLGGLVADAGGTPLPLGIVPDDAAALRAVLENALAGGADAIVVSAGSSVGTRDVTTDVIAALGPPGVWCHGLAIKPGKPTILARCGDTPIVGLPGNPLSALVVFRLIGTPLVRALAGVTDPPPPATVRGVLSRAVPSAAGRLDIVQVTVAGGVVEPLFGKSGLLSLLTRADGFITIDEPLTGLAAGAEVAVERYL